MTLFERYAVLLKKRFSDDFQEVNRATIVLRPCTLTDSEIVSTDDYMPMPIQSLEEYDKVLNVSWYNPEKPREEQAYVYALSLLLIPTDRLSFPCVLPFSQMYPLCCIDIRNFLNQFYFFASDDFAHPSVIDKAVKQVGSLAAI